MVPQATAPRGESGSAGPYGVDFESDRRLLASADDDGIRLLDTSTAREVAHLAIGRSHSAQFDPKGGGLVTYGRSGLYYWPMRTPDSSKSGQSERIGPPRPLYYPGNEEFGRVGWDRDGSVLAWVDNRNQRGLAMKMHPPGKRVVLPDRFRIMSVALSPDGKWAAAAAWQDTSVKVWDTASGKTVATLERSGPEIHVHSAVFSPDGQWLVVGSDADYRWWRTGSWKSGLTISRGHHEGGDALAFSRDGHLLAIARTANTVQLVDPASGRELATLTAPDRHRLSWLCFSPDGSELAAATDDHLIQLWDLRLLREQLAALGLDWDAPAYAPAHDTAAPKPIRVKVELGDAAQLVTGPDPFQVGVDSFLLALNPYHFLPYLERGRAYDRLGATQKAIDDYSVALALMPQDDTRRADVLLRRAEDYLSINDDSKSFADLHQVVRLAPQDAELHTKPFANFLLQRAFEYQMRAKDEVKALADLRRAVELDPNHAVALNNLAQLYINGQVKLRDPHKALPLALRAVEVAPENAYCRNTLGVAYYRVGLYRQAVVELERSLGESHGGRAAYQLFLLAMCHARLGDMTKARECYGQAVHWKPEQAQNLPSNWAERLKAFRAEADAVLAETAHP